MFKIPNNNQITQTNDSDLISPIYSSRNMDFQTPGYMKLAKSTFAFYTEADDASGDFDLCDAMYRATSDWGGPGADVLFLSDDTFRMDTGQSLTGGGIDNETTDDGAPTPGVREGVVFFNEDWVVTDGSSIKYRDSGTWTSITDTPVGDGDFNVLALFPEQSSMLVGSGNTVVMVNTAWSVVSTLTLDSRYEVVSIDANGASAYIGVHDLHENNGALIKWNGATTSAQGIYEVNAYSVDLVLKYKQGVVCATSRGELLYFGGSAFQRLAKFPNYDRNWIIGDEGDAQEFIRNSGGLVENDNIYIIVNDEVTNTDKTHYTDMPGGIWCYTPTVGLYHMYSTTRNTFISKPISDSDVNTTTNTITVSLGAGESIPETGTPLIFTSANQIVGLKNGTVYYCIKASSTTFQVALTPTDAENGDEIDLTSASTGATVYFYQRKDYGATRIHNFYMALSKLPEEDDDMNSPMFSYQADDNSLDGSYYLGAVNPQMINEGHFITAKLRPDTSTSKFPSITVKHKPLKTGETITIKYRTSDSEIDNTGETTLTWTDTSTFTTDGNLHELVVGDEIQLTGGAGAGQTFIVASISESAGTYTITTTEANDLISASDESYFVASNWKKMTTLTRDSEIKDYSIDTGSAPWVQFKIELHGVRVTIEELLVDNVKW